ncbi:MAG: 50S ribosomal protein L3 [Bifidobacteriaceae bacterium]|jgi:large subunit ribosomal protein L3|nr:50S ribosomal protein L3 [Bifidobacteriaceae bacterium]
MAAKQNEKRKALIGKKLGMTQLWDESGVFVPVTVIDVGSNVVTQIKTATTDGYDSVQLAYGQIDPKKVTKAVKGHFEKAKVPPRRYLVEFQTKDVKEYKLGQELNIDQFDVGTIVDVSGTTKGKGFAGTMKRYNFAGVSSSHGAHRNHRKPGSIGACATPGRVFKGLRMSGRMGGLKKTIQNLVLFAKDNEKGYLLIKGAVPGGRGSIVVVKNAVKVA